MSSAKKGGFPLWILAVVIPGGVSLLGFCACGGLFLLGSVSRPTADTTDRPTGRYPAPTTKYQGRTAEEWGRRALDADTTDCRLACQALNQLGAEGVPFLLKAMGAQEGRPENLSNCLVWCDGSLLDSQDLAIVARYLDEKYSKYDDWQIGSVRSAAVYTLGRAGPKAKPYLPQIEALTGNQHLQKEAREAIMSIGD